MGILEQFWTDIVPKMCDNTNKEFYNSYVAYKKLTHSSNYQHILFFYSELAQEKDGVVYVTEGYVPDKESGDLTDPEPTNKIIGILRAYLEENADDLILVKFARKYAVQPQPDDLSKRQRITVLKSRSWKFSKTSSSAVRRAPARAIWSAATSSLCSPGKKMTITISRWSGSSSPPAPCTRISGAAISR